MIGHEEFLHGHVKLKILILILIFPQKILPRLSEWPKTYSEVFAIFGKDHFGQRNLIFTP